MFQKTVLGALVVAAAAAAVLVVKELRDRRSEEDEEDQQENDGENAAADDDDEIHFVEIKDGSEENKSSAHLDGVKMDDSDDEDDDDDVEIHKFDSADHHEEDVKEEPEEEEESEEKKAAAPQVNEEEGPHEIPISDGDEEAPAADEEEPDTEAETDAGSDDEQEEDFSDEVKEVAELYPYLKPAFIKEILDRNDAYNAQFPEDTLVCAVHHVKFADLHSLLHFEGILNDAGYTCTHQEDGSVQGSKRFFVEDGAIISDILNVANQAVALGGTYQDCDLVQ